MAQEAEACRGFQGFECLKWSLGFGAQALGFRVLGFRILEFRL